jgi:hypothetical protein
MGEQLAPERAARVRAREVLGPKPARIQQRHGERVAQRQLRGGAGRGRQVQRAGFLLDAAVQHDVGMASQGGIRIARHRHQRHAQPLEHRQDDGDLVDSRHHWKWPAPGRPS